MSKIAIDCDGVLADFNEAFTGVVNRLWPGKIEAGFKPHDWNYGGRLTDEEMDKAWEVIRHTENFWLGLQAYGNSIGYLAHFMIEQRSHEILIVTSRAATAGLPVAEQTRMWLRACGLSPIYNYLGVLTVDDSNEKWRVYLAAGFDYSIDDKMETVEQCDLIHPRLSNHKAFLLDRAWNQGAKVKRRVRTLGEYLKEIR